MQKIAPNIIFGPSIPATIIAWADIHNGLVTALATLAIGFLTGGLIYSSNKLAGIADSQTTLIKAQGDIAQAQHLAEHRPHLRVRHVSLGTPQVPLRLPSVDSEVIGELVVVNVGGTKATIIDSRYLVHFARTALGLPMHSTLDDGWGELFPPNTILQIGESCSLPISGNISLGTAQPQGTFIQLGDRDWCVYVMGQIQYQDDGGSDRFMGFCRQWCGTGTFRAVDDPDYEYED